MENDNKVEPEYLKGFNEGYIMAQHQPELAEKLARIETDFIRAVAFRDGYAQYTKEKLRERLPKWLKTDRTPDDRGASDKSKDRDIDLDRE